MPSAVGCNMWDGSYRNSRERSRGCRWFHLFCLLVSLLAFIFQQVFFPFYTMLFSLTPTSSPPQNCVLVFLKISRRPFSKFIVHSHSIPLLFFVFLFPFPFSFSCQMCLSSTCLYILPFLLIFPPLNFQVYLSLSLFSSIVQFLVF